MPPGMVLIFDLYILFIYLLTNNIIHLTKKIWFGKFSYTILKVFRVVSVYKNEPNNVHQVY